MRAENLTGLLRETRVHAGGEVLPSRGRSFTEVLGVSSADADLVMLGVGELGADFTSCYGRPPNLADGLGRVVLVLAAQDLPFKQFLRWRHGPRSDFLGSAFAPRCTRGRRSS